MKHARRQTSPGKPRSTVSSSALSRNRRIWWLVGGAGVLALLLIVFWPRDPNGLPGADWRLFKRQFVTPDGRVVDTGNGDISHSEGQGYAMLLAVAFDDQRTFDRLWKWTRENLRRPEDHLFSWKWTPEEAGGRVADVNNASDGDLLIAWALWRASERWDDLAHRQASAQIVADFFRLVVVESPIGLQMLPGLEGFRKAGGVDLNPSYVLFPAYEEMAGAFPAEAWTRLAEGGRQLLGLGRFGERELNANWIWVGPLALRMVPERSPEFGYDAIRVPLHAAWARNEVDLLRPYAAFWQSLPVDQPLPATVNLVDGEFGPYPMLPGMQAVVSLTLAVADKKPLTVRDIPRLSADEVYYSASLKLLTKLAIHDLAKPLND